jgi:transposase
MEIDIKNLPKSPELLEKIIIELQVELTAYKEKYARLIEEIALAKQQRFSPSSEKNSLQLDLFDEAGNELPAEVKEQLDDEIEVSNHVRKKHPVRRLLPKELPREIVMYDISESEKRCHCGASLVRIGEEITEQLNYIPAQLSVIQHVRPKYGCKPCQETIKIAPMPVLLLPKSIATPELVAHTIISKYCDHVPLYRQEAIWQRFDIDMPRSSLCGWVLKTAELCEPLIKLLRAEIINTDYAQADETTVQVLTEVGRSNTANSFMWCYRGGGLHSSIVFDYQETRGGYHAQTFLAGFKGFLQTDAYAGYNWADSDGNIIPVGCHAHARRPFAELVKLSKTSGLAHEALKFYKKLYAIEKNARENNLSAPARYELRNTEAIPILSAFKKWLDLQLTKTPEQSKIGKGIRYCLKNWIELTNYLKDGRIEIDNNLIENAIRPFALGRKNWLFSGSPKGAKAGAVLYSLVETCKAQQIEPYKYFCAMLHRLRHCKTEEDYKNILPQFIRF